MSLHDKIAKLPEWPDPNALFIVTWHVAPHLPALCAAALARLELAREWIAKAHVSYCDYEMYQGRMRCTCGRDALLAAITPPATSP
jgi:hypothetical protein